MAVPLRVATGLSVNIGARFHIEIAKEADALAKKLGMGRTDLMREALYAHLADLLGGPSEFEIRLEGPWKTPAPLRMVGRRAVLHAMVHEEVAKDVESIAEELGVTKPSILRDALHKFLREYRGGPSPYEHEINSQVATPSSRVKGAVGRPSNGLSEMPGVRTNVHPKVAERLAAEAHKRDIAVSSLIREIIYDYALKEYGLDVGPAPLMSKIGGGEVQE